MPVIGPAWNPSLSPFAVAKNVQGLTLVQVPSNGGAARGQSSTPN